MRKIFFFIGSVLLGVSLMVAGTAYALGSPIYTFGGGSGTTSPSGILAGDNGATNHLNTVKIGSNLTWDGTTLSATGGSGTPGGTSGQLQYNATGAFAGVSTTTVTCSGNTSCTSFVAIGGSPITISSTGGGTGLSTTTPLSGSNLLVYSAAGAGSAYGIATTTLTGSGVISISNAPVLIGASPAVATLTGGSNGQVLGWLSGVPTWTASSTVAAGTGISVSTAGSVNTITNTIGFPFTPATDFGINTSATTTALWGQNSIFASSTSATRPALAASNSGGGPAAVFDVGNVGIGTTSPYAKLSVVGQVVAPYYTATSTTATSTFAGDVAIGGNSGNPNPYLFIGTSTSYVPLYGRVQGDIIDAEYDWNGQSSINVANANTGSCASATFFADGNNPSLGGYYGTFSFLNDGWTGVGCSIGVGTAQKPEAVAIASPTGEMDFVIASTTNNGYADFNWFSNTNTQLAKLTNAGSFGIGSTSPHATASFNRGNTSTTGNIIEASYSTGATNNSTTTVFSLASSTAASLLIGTTTPANGSASATSTIYMQKLQFQGGNSAGTTVCGFVNASNAFTIQAGPCL